MALTVLAAAAIGGSLAGWYVRFPWYDDVVHVGLGFAVTLAAGVWLTGRVLTGSSAYPRLFVLVLTLIGVGTGAAWEVLEFAYDLALPRDVIKAKFDTMIDLLCDTGGAVIAAIWMARRFAHS